MKGMRKIRRGKNFAGVVQYALKPGAHHKCDPVVIGGNMLGDTAHELIAEFDGTRQLRPDVQKPVWHNSLRLPDGESLTAEQWSSIADDYMRRMGFSDTHLRCYVLHDDDGQHIHIIASRIDLNGGKLYLGRNENLISTQIISKLEVAHGLTVTKTASPPSQAQPKRKRVSRNEKMLSERTGVLSPREALQQILDKSLSDKPDLLTFTKRLEEAEVSCTANVASTGKMNGFSFSYRDIAFKASQLGKSYSWANLSNRLNYNPDHLEALPAHIPMSAPVPVPVPVEQIAKANVRSESIGDKIAEIELRLSEDRRNEIVEKILQKNAVQQQKHLLFLRRLASLKQFIELLRSYGKSILHKTHTHLSKIHVMQPLNKARKIRL
ncbi:TPA: relaxase/mobilization nuclease domain-containing protein [Salmonella enterica subsp. enterica serovar Abortusovis]|uniref:relaxase/mobilization nuclease domain-containing protein n=1 Tax=Salmonella enterica TaxID=28901 RepID=UPI002ACE4855|nr:relaxase/mobilization nuclease domain-containing protein [Salmonella enterica]WQG00375.1 relaxase/mobilization nuclease domain-containing protein [Salmonella enterica subsp. enterica serovar Abortusovis]WQG09247.1 relaxase/mobilization nuclease domain-containing protein [Salmonella enterica subsp. enterica serovar Abortusovis]WQG13745.1 relaxase/mobilization nuclease domain-containing protein [Salmonella enterica subsp. enterica serovar Abortusovis]HCT0247074.1 relaxase/mobilization nuclease